MRIWQADKPPTMKPRFTITALLILTTIVAAFLAGRQSTALRREMLLAEVERWRAEATQQRAVSKQHEAKITAFKKQIISNQFSQPIRFVSWNVESGGNDPSVIAEQLANELEKYDCYGLTEVSPSNVRRYHQAIQTKWGAGYAFLSTTNGGGDRMLLIYNMSRLERISFFELEEHELSLIHI